MVCGCQQTVSGTTPVHSWALLEEKVMEESYLHFAVPGLAGCQVSWMPVKHLEKEPWGGYRICISRTESIALICCAELWGKTPLDSFVLKRLWRLLLQIRKSCPPVSYDLKSSLVEKRHINSPSRSRYFSTLMYYCFSVTFPQEQSVCILPLFGFKSINIPFLFFLSCRLFSLTYTIIQLKTFEIHGWI